MAGGRRVGHALRSGLRTGDVIGERVVFATSLTIAGAALWPEYILDFAIAYALGILFQVLRHQADERPEHASPARTGGSR